MSLQTLPSPHEITGGGNPYYDAAGNIAGFSDGPAPVTVDLPGDYDRYLQPAAPFLAGLGEDDFSANWPIAVAAGAYGYIRARSATGLLLGLLAGWYLPRATPVALALDAALSHDGVRMTALRYAQR